MSSLQRELADHPNSNKAPQEQIIPCVLFPILSSSQKLTRKDIISVCMHLFIISISSLGYKIHGGRDSVYTVHCCGSNMENITSDIQSQSSINITLQLTMCVPKQRHLEGGRFNESNRNKINYPQLISLF